MPHIADLLSAAAASSLATSWADFTINTVGLVFGMDRFQFGIAAHLCMPSHHALLAVRSGVTSAGFDAQ